MTNAASGPSPANIVLEQALLENAESAMFAAVEIHNKPIFQYRYEVCTLLIINAWELALKAFIAKEMKEVVLVGKDGTSKPFLECVACISSKLAKPFETIKHNLQVLYKYRNEVAHFYPEDLGVLVLGLLKASVRFFVEFVEQNFGRRLYEKSNLLLLPIGFSKPISPLDFISNQSAAKHCSKEVRGFLEAIKESSKALQQQGIDDSIVVNYSIALMNESRVKNADLTAAINNAVPQNNVIAVHNVISKAMLTNDPAAKQIRIVEEHVYDTIFTERYADVIQKARAMFEDFILNHEFNQLMKELKKNPNLMRVRLLDPSNPKGSHKDFYSKLIYEELGKRYKRRG